MRDKQLPIVDFTVYELDYFRKYCNFTYEESEFFEYRCSPENYTIPTIAYKMCISERTAHTLNKKIKSKIRKVLPTMRI